MANNCLEFSEVLSRLSTEEEAWLKDQLEIVCVYGDKEDAEGTAPYDVAASEDLDWSGCRAFRDMDDFETEFVDDAEFKYTFSRDDEDDEWGRHLWIRSAEYGNVAQVAHLVQKFLKKFRPGVAWALTWATTCSKPRAGAFGGGAVFVTASDIKWNDAHEFIEQQAEAFAASIRKEGEPT